MSGASRFPGYASLLGVEQMLSLPARPGREPQPVRSQVDYICWHAMAVVRRGAMPFPSPEPTSARVNHGRWLADCYWCGAAMATSPALATALCTECGAAYGTANAKPVNFPAELAELERLLLARPRRANQNWRPGETLVDLARENRLHGVRSEA